MLLDILLEIHTIDDEMMICGWTPSDSHFPAEIDHIRMVFFQIRAEKGKTGPPSFQFYMILCLGRKSPSGPLWLRILHCDWSSDLITSKQTKNFRFSTLIWKNNSLIWSISTRKCDVRKVHPHIIINIIIWLKKV